MKTGVRRVGLSGLGAASEARLRQPLPLHREQCRRRPAPSFFSSRYPGCVFLMPSFPNPGHGGGGGSSLGSRLARDSVAATHPPVTHGTSTGPAAKHGTAGGDVGQARDGAVAKQGRHVTGLAAKQGSAGPASASTALAPPRPPPHFLPTRHPGARPPCARPLRQESSFPPSASSLSSASHTSAVAACGGTHRRPTGRPPPPPSGRAGADRESKMVGHSSRRLEVEDN
jgi:hypothetical protein